MMTETLKQLMEALVAVDCHIADKTIQVDELKTLLLIIYHEILNKEEQLPILKDYLALVIKHFIDLENEVQQILLQQQENEDTKIITTLIHERITSPLQGD